jgi:hypothetical protein
VLLLGGTKIALAANTTAALNDITHAEVGLELRVLGLRFTV